MNAERWATLKSLFLDAASLAPEEQQAFLRDLERADSEVAALLEQLLQQQSGSGPNLRQACWSPSGDIVSPQALDAGRILMDRFEIVGFLGSGGLGEVYSVYDRRQKVTLALKTLQAVLADDQSALDSLRNEVNMARLVTHPNVCRIHDFHWDAATALPFVTMELLEGETLAQRLRRGGSYWATPSGEAIFIRRCFAFPRQRKEPYTRSR